MLKKQLACFLLSICTCLLLSAQSPVPGSVVQTKDGITMYLDSNLSGGARVVRLQVVSDKIIRVTASATARFPAVKSLIAVYPATVAGHTVEKKGDQVLLKTASLTASVQPATGAVRFLDKSGTTLLAERRYNGRSFVPAVFEGQPSFGITQTFETTPDDAYYGLGQHQADQFNYKGQQVFLFQNNTEVGVPFLVSSKNYGILWDNYSLTKIGDTRAFEQLSSLRLYDKNGGYGWLTASYSNDKTKPDDIAFTRAESVIDYPYLDDTKKGLPAAFKPQSGTLTWEGAIASDMEGMHKLMMTYGGAAKVWIDGKLLVDRWRQAWNPGSVVLNLDMQKGKKYPIKIFWSPDGSESYISVKALTPVAAKDANAYSFSSEAGQQLDYYFVKGSNMDEVIAGYRTITGKATMVPKWAMGFWQSRERYKTEEELLSTVAEFRKRNIPLDNIVQDWSYWKENDWGSQEFDASRFGSPDSMIRELHNTYHTHFMISVWPKMYEGIAAYKDFDAKGLLY